jgi:hypothetical protein
MMAKLGLGNEQVMLLWTLKLSWNVLAEVSRTCQNHPVALFQAEHININSSRPLSIKSYYKYIYMCVCVCY